MAAAAGGGAGAGAGRVVTAAELATHNTAESCWVALHGRVYDLTTFLADHPGGARVIAREAGRDGTTAFEAVHPKDIISRLGLEQKLFVGRYDGPAAPPAPAPPAAAAHAVQKTAAVKAAAPSAGGGGGGSGGSKPPLEAMMNVFDFEAVAADVMPKEAWDYYSSGADDELTLRENRSVYQRVWVAPRVMVDVKRVHSGTTLLGTRASFPLYISATALARLAHPDGEQALVRAARSAGVPYMLPTLSSCSLDEMLSAADLKQQTLWTQLYVNTNRAATEQYVRRAEAGGCRALFITVDAPQLGRREKDMRNKFTAKAADVQADADAKGQVKRSEGTARAISAFIDPSLSWADLQWFRSITRMPIVLKGVQCAADALLAVEHGCAGVVLSNHGGRQMDTSRSALEILAEVMRALRARGWEHRIEVYVDGGVRRGSDIFKALALGAKAVGVGRPVLYGLAAYGQAGVERVLEMFRDELHTAMRQCGTPAVCDINESLLAGTRNLTDHVVPAPADHLSLATYKPLIALSKL